MKEYVIGDVFGLSRDVPINYVVRKVIDGELVDSLTRGKHIVIHGSSKQGKTCLRKHCLDDGDYIVTTCQSKWNVADLNSAILKGAGFEIRMSTEKTETGAIKVIAEVSGELKVPLVAKGKASLGAEGATMNTKGERFEPLKLDPNDVNDIVRALSSIQFEKYVVLEDFHYLPISTQKEFSNTLKAYHENSKLCFIIVGVWKESNRLTRYNGDLTNRVISIDADAWATEELVEVIEQGEELLNIEFSDKFKDELVSSCFDSVYIVQECCYRACQNVNVFSTQKQKKLISTDVSAEDMISKVVGEQSGRYNQALVTFSRGFQDTKLEMYKWLVYAILSVGADVMENGLKLSHFNKTIKQKHPSGRELQVANITNALSNIGSLQSNKEIRPVIFDYDEQVLYVVDRSFLIWISVQNKNDIFELVDLPQYVIETQ